MCSFLVGKSTKTRFLYQGRGSRRGARDRPRSWHEKGLSGCGRGEGCRPRWFRVITYIRYIVRASSWQHAAFMIVVVNGRWGNEVTAYRTHGGAARPCAQRENTPKQDGPCGWVGGWVCILRCVSGEPSLREPPVPALRVLCAFHLDCWRTGAGVGGGGAAAADRTPSCQSGVEIPT